LIGRFVAVKNRGMRCKGNGKESRKEEKERRENGGMGWDEKG